jgi:hypothetical protein
MVTGSEAEAISMDFLLFINNITKLPGIPMGIFAELFSEVFWSGSVDAFTMFHIHSFIQCGQKIQEMHCTH